MTSPRFFLVTNDLPRAALAIWCHPGNVPRWIGIADNLDLMMRIPDGARVRCLWFGIREELEPWENCWWARRVKGGFEWISEEEWATIMDWAETNRKGPSNALLFGAVVEAGFTSPLAGSGATGEAGQIDEVDLSRGGLSADRAKADRRAAPAKRASPSRSVALGPSQPRIDPQDRPAPSAMSRASKWI